MSFETINYAVDKQVALISLNRPERKNSLNKIMRAELLAAIKQAEADASVNVIVLTGAGSIFSAGQDITEKGDGGASTVTLIETEYKPIVMAITGCEKPVISAVNGVAAGAAGAIALCCDLVVMAQNASIYEAFIAIGLVPDAGTSWLLSKAMGSKRAYQAIVDCEKISAETCLATGLINKIEPQQALLANTLLWAQTLAQKAPLALRFAKKTIAKAQNMSLSDTISYEAGLQSVATASQDAHEGVAAFLEKRQPQFVGK